MTNFIWEKSKFPDVPRVLVSTVEGFEASPEYRKLPDYERDISGVVVGAFAAYLCRLHEQLQAGEKDDGLRMAVISAHDAIEEMAGSSESAMIDLVTDEIYENLDCKPEVLKSIQEHLKPVSLTLYQRWSARTH
jgi:hypothetical protein